MLGAGNAPARLADQKMHLTTYALNMSTLLLLESDETFCPNAKGVAPNDRTRALAAIWHNPYSRTRCARSNLCLAILTPQASFESAKNRCGIATFAVSGARCA